MEAVRILMSGRAHERLHTRLVDTLADREPVWIDPDIAPSEADIAFVSRDVTGLSTKARVEPATQRFYDALAGSAGLRWVHVHSAGADRPVYVELVRRGVAVTTSSGANASVVVQSALAAILSIARSFPTLLNAQREHRWAQLIGGDLPPDLEGQTALIVGWGPIGRGLATLLDALGLSVVAGRSTDANDPPAALTVPFERLAELLPVADWLVLACPLTARTRGLIDRDALARLPAGARIVNVARGEIVDEPALIEALVDGRLAGAYLDVHAQEPLPPTSPLWALPNVIVSPHSAGQSAGNERRVDEMFIANLARWVRGEALVQRVGADGR